MRDHFGLSSDQWAFGDCGAFSYASEHNPTISVEQAVAVYELYDFDLGASVDHIPLARVVDADGRRRKLSDQVRKRRVKLTRDNAEEFIRVWKARACRFTPVGIIQGIEATEYACQVHAYREMGYNHIALGALVPRSDEDIRQIVLEVSRALKNCREKPWVHLLGIFRPRLQETFRHCGIDSFDSATALRKYDAGRLNLNSCLSALLSYDRLLGRGEFSSNSLRDHYRRTLENRPWRNCKCQICREIGIDVAIFRGYNRNKRRGAHNTLQLYGRVLGDSR